MAKEGITGRLGSIEECRIAFIDADGSSGSALQRVCQRLEKVCVRANTRAIVCAREASKDRSLRLLSMSVFVYTIEKIASSE